MFKFLRERKKDNKGFTLVELVIVVAILAILVGLLAPQYTKYVEKSRQAADIDNMEEMVKAVQVYVVDERTETKDTVDGAAKITLGEHVTVAAIANKTDLSATVTAALEEYVKNYSNIKRKAKQWTEDPYVELTIEKDGTVEVNYQPSDFATALGK